MMEVAIGSCYDWRRSFAFLSYFPVTSKCGVIKIICRPDICLLALRSSSSPETIQGFLFYANLEERGSPAGKELFFLPPSSSFSFLADPREVSPDHVPLFHFRESQEQLGCLFSHMNSALNCEGCFLNLRCSVDPSPVGGSQSLTSRVIGERSDTVGERGGAFEVPREPRRDIGSLRTPA